MKKIVLCVNKDIYATYCLKLLEEFLRPHQISLISTISVSTPPQHLSDLATFEKQLLDSALSRENIYEDKIWEKKLTLSNQQNHQKLQEFLTDTQPDLIISIRFGCIFKEAELSMSKYGIINLHSGIIPNYRGIMSSFHALYAGEQNPVFLITISE